jgi:hypothetical protein
MNDDDRIEAVAAPYRYGNEQMPRAKPEERLTRGMRVEDFFGICAEEFDDEFMESLRAIRRSKGTVGSAT